MNEERERADAIEMGMKFWRRLRREVLAQKEKDKKQKEEENKWLGKADVAHQRMVKNIKTVRCEECSTVLPYGSRPFYDAKDLDSEPRYLCRRCKKERHYSLTIDAEKSYHKSRELPLKKECQGETIEVNGIPRVILGCNALYKDTPMGNRQCIHSSKCEVFYYKLTH